MAEGELGMTTVLAVLAVLAVLMGDEVLEPLPPEALGKPG